MAEKQIAMIKLQGIETRPTGPQTTREQDRIRDDVASDWEFIQDRRARWSRTRYADAFEQAVREDLRDPALRNEDPFKASETKAASRFDWYPWFIGASLIALIFAVCWVALRAAFVLAWLLRVLGIANGGPVARGFAAAPMPSPVPQPGDNSRPCPSCDATGRERCQFCMGRRTWWEAAPDGNGRTVYCQMCAAGTPPCGVCRGSGRVNW